MRGFDKTGISQWRGTISRRVNEREIRRQTMYNSLSKAARHNTIGTYIGNHVPAIVSDYFGMLAGSLLAFWIVGFLLSYVHANRLYTYPVLGLLYSLQTTYYKYRLSVDPDYKIPACKCAGRRSEGTEKVLKSREGAIVGIPNSVLAVAFYSAFLVLTYLKHFDAVLYVAILAVVVSAYVSYVMVAKIGSLCVNCINISALNLLILFHLVLLRSKT